MYMQKFAKASFLQSRDPKHSRKKKKDEIKNLPNFGLRSKKVRENVLMVTVIMNKLFIYYRNYGIFHIPKGIILKNSKLSFKIF